MISKLILLGYQITNNKPQNNKPSTWLCIASYLNNRTIVTETFELKVVANEVLCEL